MKPPPNGTRIRLLSMPNDPCPIEVGSEGTVWGGYDGSTPDTSQVWVEWDNKRSLNLIPTIDTWEVIT